MTDIEYPDKTVQNPYYRCAAEMKLYNIEKVERIEKYKRFIKFRDSNPKKQLIKGIQ